MHEVDLAVYLFSRLNDLGIRSVHGSVGECDNPLLDYLQLAHLNWVESSDVSSAGYAADGSARVKGVSTVITFSGAQASLTPGAIATACAERGAVVLITCISVGETGREEHTRGHSGCAISRPPFNQLMNLTMPQTVLDDSRCAPNSVDAILKECVLANRPVHIVIPSNMLAAKVTKPLSPINFVIPEYNEYLENEMIGVILDKVYKATQPLIIVDGLAARCSVRGEINALVKRTGFPTLTAPFGKSYVDENMPNYYGVYVGRESPAQKSWVDQRDLILHFGPLRTESNTFGFTAIPPATKTITFEKYSVKFDDRNLLSGVVPGRRVYMKSLLEKLLDRLDQSRISSPSKCHPGRHQMEKAVPSIEGIFAPTLTALWSTISSFLRSGDVIVLDMSTYYLGSLGITFPTGSTLINSSGWASVGQIVGACQGIAHALRELVVVAADEVIGTHTPQTQLNRVHGFRRTILFINASALHSNTEKFLNIVRNRLDVIVFVLDEHTYQGLQFDSSLRVQKAETLQGLAAALQKFDLVYGAAKGLQIIHVNITVAHHEELLVDED